MPVVKLRNFSNSVRQVGSCVRMLSSSFYLRERLELILDLFRDNATDLFPGEMRDRNTVLNPHIRSRWKQKASARSGVPTSEEDVDAEDFPEQINGLADDVITFLDSLNEFPEFTDESIDASITALEGDLKYWASCLKAYEGQLISTTLSCRDPYHPALSGQFKYPAVQRYLHDLTAEMGEHLDSINSSLSVFIEIGPSLTLCTSFLQKSDRLRAGVPIILTAQNRATENILTLSTVATFFSAVTATTLQFSYQEVNNLVQNGVNCFWFASLGFSTTTVANTLLHVMWRRSML